MMKSTLNRLSFLGLACAGALHLQAGDWTQFRGPQGNSTSGETGLPLDPKPSSIQWKIELPGEGLSSPVVIGNRLYLTASSGPDQKTLHVFCLDASNGREIWHRRFVATGRTMCHDKTSVAAPSPVSDGKRIYALFSSNDLFCLDLEGNLVWLRGLTHDYPNASNSLGMSSSPILIDGVLVVQVENDSESFTAGLDVDTGTNLWKLDRPKAANWTSPTRMQDSTGRHVALIQSSKGLLAVDPRTGSELWDFDRGAATIPSTTVANGVLYVPSNGVTALRPGVNGKPPEELWRSRQLNPATASPVVIGNHVFTINNAGILTCGDIQDGNRLWQMRLVGPFSATPIAVGPYLYCVNEKGLLQVVDTRPEEGKLMGSLELKDTILSTPAIARSSLFVRSDKHLWCIAGS